MTLGREDGLENLDVSCLVFPERKMAKSSDSYSGERTKGDHMLACALGLGLVLPAPAKAESPHHEGSKANRTAAKHSHEGMLYKTGSQKSFVAILIRRILNHKLKLNLPEARRESQHSSIPFPVFGQCKGHVGKQNLPCKQPSFSHLLDVFRGCPHHSFAVTLLPNICLP